MSMLTLPGTFTLPVTVGFIKENWIVDQFTEAITGTGGLGKTLTDIVLEKSTVNGKASVIANLQSDLSGVAASVTASMQALALAISLVFFLIALLELSTTERLTLEFFIKFFSKLVISVALIFAIPTLLNLIPKFGGALADSYNKAAFAMGSHSSSSPGDVLDANKARESIAAMVNKAYNAEGMKMAVVFEGFVFGILMKVASFIITGIAYIVCVSRLLELTVRGCFMPIAVALISDDGWRGAGGRYIRKYIAVACQGAVIVMIGKLTQFIMGKAGLAVINNLAASVDNYSLSAGIEGTFVLLAIAIACVSMLFKSIGIVNDVFGA